MALERLPGTAPALWTWLRVTHHCPECPSAVSASGTTETIKKLPRVNFVVLNYIPIKVLLREGKKKKASKEARSSLTAHPPPLTFCRHQSLFKQGFSPPPHAPGLHSCPFSIVPSLSGSFHGGQHTRCVSANKQPLLESGELRNKYSREITNRQYRVPRVPVVFSLCRIKVLPLNLIFYNFNRRKRGCGKKQ